MHAGTQLTMSDITERTHHKEKWIFGPEASTPMHCRRALKRSSLLHVHKVRLCCSEISCSL